MKTKDVPRSEKRLNISISNYDYDEKEEKIYLIKVSKEIMEYQVDIFLVNNGQTNQYYH